jgi:hypothetical protein
LYVIGGSRDFDSHENEENTNVGDMYKLDLESFEWSKVETIGNPPIASNRPVCSIKGDLMYYSGIFIFFFIFF